MSTTATRKPSRPSKATRRPNVSTWISLPSALRCRQLRLGMIDVADLLQRLAMGYPFVLRPDLAKLHAQERRAAVAVVLHRRVVDAEEFGRLGIEHPHRHRIVVEQQAKRGFAPLERRDVRNRQRENVAERLRAQLQVAIIAVDFELVAGCRSLMTSSNRSITSGRHSRFPPALSRRHSRSVDGSFRSRDAP